MFGVQVKHALKAIRIEKRLVSMEIIAERFDYENKFSVILV